MGQGTYLIVDVTGPASAPAGSTVNIGVPVANIYSGPIEVRVTGDVNGQSIDFGSDQVVNPSLAGAWYGSFIMPNQNALVRVDAWYKANDGLWYKDASASRTVTVQQAAEPVFSGLVASYAKA